MVEGGKNLSGLTLGTDGEDHIMKSLQNTDGISSPPNLTNVINDCFICPTREFLPLQANFIPEGDSSLSTPFAVSTNTVYKKLLSNSAKAQGPDVVPACCQRRTQTVCRNLLQIFSIAPFPRQTTTNMEKSKRSSCPERKTNIGC